MKLTDFKLGQQISGKKHRDKNTTADGFNELFQVVIPVGSSSVNLIIPVQGADGPAVGEGGTMKLES